MRWVDRKNRLSSWQMGHIVSGEWTREKEKDWWLATWVYFYWKEAFLSQKITLHLEMLHQIIALSCIGENPLLVPCGIRSHMLAGHCHSGWERIQATLPAILLEPIQSDTKQGECLFLSENNVVVGVVGHCVNSIAQRSSMKIHLESLILHLCTKSYPNGNHLLYTYTL